MSEMNGAGLEEGEDADIGWDVWVPPPELREIRPQPTGPGDLWFTPRGELRMTGPVPAGPAVIVLAGLAVAGVAGVPVYAWHRDWPRVAACAVLAAGCGWLAVRLARY